ncbi:DUF3301 domain-containing protein [Wenzhouxiangella sp. XN79A]|nr:DUF3301 domain-containing protein [Wenzhouxiangella sp. XN79A]NKI34232.1 DUF3301 domain-containing protein [Wenzhouxiangella sp. XN79A]
MLVLGAVALWWAGAVAARDRAIAAARGLCREQGWQLLDETVALNRLRPVRGERGLLLERRYRFEFSTDGGERSVGGLNLRGPNVTLRWAETPEGRLIEQRLGRGRQ